MNHAARRAAAGERADAALASLEPDERRVMEACIGRYADEWADILREVDMTDAAAIALVQSGAAKLAVFYAERDAAEHRRAGRLQ